VIKITWDQGLKRVYQKKVRNNPDLKKRFWKALGMLTKNPFHPALRTHKLVGKLEGLWAFSVAYDCRVVFRFMNGDEVLLVDIGGHGEVY
jgi:mRNA-degrading endonuclease YafQ of YafQ-DinJ toxin-antitoxin module